MVSSSGGMIMLLWLALASASQEQPLAEAKGSTTGYPSVAAALAALKLKQGAEFSTQGGWTIVSDPSGPTVWSFAPPGDPAYPSAVKRQVVTRDSGVNIVMSVQCESSKAACDNLVKEFNQLNAEMSQSLPGRRG